VKSPAILLLAALSLLGQPAPDWSGWKFLIGEWSGEGTGTPGQGSGGFSSLPDLSGRVLIRKNRAEYPATKDKPAYSHEDLMVIYPDTPVERAVYFDNEGHVIHYTAEFKGPGEVVLTSEARKPEPRFRLTYTKLGPDRIGIRFEIASPGKPDAFAPYIEATAHRK
jgi:hypothetical protein